MADSSKISLQYFICLESVMTCSSQPLMILAACRYRRKREKLVERAAVSRLPTKWGLFQSYCYRSKLDGIEHIALVKVKNSFLFFETMNTC